MTNFEYIKTLDKKDMAKILISEFDIIDGETNTCCYRTSSGCSWFGDDVLGDAFNSELKWLDEEYNPYRFYYWSKVW